MFSKSSKANANSRDRRPSPSIIAADCAITGNILSQGEVHVDGSVDGDVRCDMLVIGPTGNIIGEISAELVRVLGSVTGQIKARAVELAKTAHVVGDITHETLSIEAGAFVEGRFDRMTDQTVAPKALPTSDRNAAGQALLTDQADNKTDEKQQEKKVEETQLSLQDADAVVAATA